METPIRLLQFDRGFVFSIAMDLRHIIDELRGEWERLNDAILALERLSEQLPRRRGRPEGRISEPSLKQVVSRRKAAGPKLGKKRPDDSAAK